MILYPEREYQKAKNEFNDYLSKHQDAYTSYMQAMDACTDIPDEYERNEALAQTERGERFHRHVQEVARLIFNLQQAEKKRSPIITADDDPDFKYWERMINPALPGNPHYEPKKREVFDMGKSRRSSTIKITNNPLAR